jgi:hypothetical protein
MLAAILQNNQNVIPVPPLPQPSRIVNQGASVGGPEGAAFDPRFDAARAAASTAPISASVTTAAVVVALSTAPVSVTVAAGDNDDDEK